MSGCLDEFLLNGERLPLDGATDRFDVEQVGPVSSECGIVTTMPFNPRSPGGGTDQPVWRLAVIIVSAVVGLCLIVLIVLLVVFCVRRLRKRHHKGRRPTARRSFTRLIHFRCFFFILLLVRPRRRRSL